MPAGQASGFYAMQCKTSNAHTTVTSLNLASFEMASFFACFDPHFRSLAITRSSNTAGLNATRPALKVTFESIPRAITLNDNKEDASQRLIFLEYLSCYL
jgi:hypothetical protein